MPRPTKWRRVSFLPQATYFKPAGIPLRFLDEIQLSVEEAEAIRLKDLEGLDQEAGAEGMNISRSTFQRVLASGRHKIADALLKGKAIRIEGGNFKIAMQRLRCRDGHEWDVSFEVMMNRPPHVCPSCKKPNILPIEPTGFVEAGKGWSRRHQGRHVDNSSTNIIKKRR